MSLLSDKKMQLEVAKTKGNYDSSQIQSGMAELKKTFEDIKGRAGSIDPQLEENYKNLMNYYQTELDALKKLEETRKKITGK